MISSSPISMPLQGPTCTQRPCLQATSCLPKLLLPGASQGLSARDHPKVQNHSKKAVICSMHRTLLAYMADDIQLFASVKDRQNHSMLCPKEPLVTPERACSSPEIMTCGSQPVSIVANVAALVLAEHAFVFDPQSRSLNLAESGMALGKVMVHRGDGISLCSPTPQQPKWQHLSGFLSGRRFQDWYLQKYSDTNHSRQPLRHSPLAA